VRIYLCAHVENEMTMLVDLGDPEALSYTVAKDRLAVVGELRDPRREHRQANDVAYSNH
jgi:hypothetical protein